MVPATQHLEIISTQLAHRNTAVRNPNRRFLAYSYGQRNGLFWFRMSLADKLAARRTKKTCRIQSVCKTKTSACRMLLAPLTVFRLLSTNHRACQLSCCLYPQTTHTCQDTHVLIKDYSTQSYGNAGTMQGEHAKNSGKGVRCELYWYAATQTTYIYTTRPAAHSVSTCHQTRGVFCDPFCSH